MRRWVVPALLALVSILATAIAVVSSRPAAGDRDRASLATPVLSVRRAPELLSQVVADSRLRARLDAELADPALGPARQASCLVATHRGRTIHSRNPSAPLIPASTMKVLTAAAALGALGPDTRMATDVRAVKPVVDGVIDGAVWVVGGGDPLLSTVDYLATFRNQPQVATSMEALADAVVAAGVKTIRGGVIGDATRFDDQRFVPTWKPSYVTDGDVGPVDALVVNDGFLAFTPRKLATSDPPEHAAAVLTTLLQARGVAVEAPAGDGATPPEARTIASVQSPTVRQLVAEMLTESDNNTAEILTKELGARLKGQGTWPGGVAAIREVLAGQGLDVGGYEAVDGSGLDRSDRLTCGLLQRALVRGGRALADGFAVAGRTGTLADRFRGSPLVGRLRAKTGSLNEVVALTGYVDAAREESVAFSLIFNELPRDAVGRAASERISAVLAAYPEAPPATELRPLPVRR